ncbi:Spermine synthase [Lamellibrachia satsuma]|nr:Spermine synthase [Lamellibrachia satsuma]
MPSHTTLLEFRVPSSTHADPATQRHVTECLGLQGFNEAHSSTTELGDGQGLIALYLRPDGSHATLRVYPDGLVVLDIQEFVKKGADPVFSSEVVGKLEKDMENCLKATNSNSLPAIRCGDAFNCYFPTTDNKLIEYDFDELVYEANSPYQNIKIYHSPQFGNMLVLDDDPNLAESDISYTHAITGCGEEYYCDKTVLVLGGGDGGILHELLKESPRFVTMVDIDQLVIDAAKCHLRGICGDSMDHLKGDNYEVLVEDSVPVTKEPTGDLWDFLRQILDLSMKVLSPAGKYFTQGNGANMTLSLAMYEKQLSKLETPVEFRKKPVHIPSYHELWVFYEIWKTQHLSEKDT